MNAPRRQRWAVLGAVLLLGACAAMLNGVPRPPFFQAIRDKIIFSHNTHGAMDLDCSTCHETVAQATTLKGSFLPLEAKCLECHQDWKDEALCGKCHTDVRYAQHWSKEEPQLTMSHADHLGRVNQDCKWCHRELSEPGKAGLKPIPMAVCTGCHHHKQEFDDGRCQPCHVSLQHKPLKPISMYSHQGDYIRRHRVDARTSAETCASCHHASFCTDCHRNNGGALPELRYPEQVESRFIHRNDFISRHSLEARADQSSCLRCHGTSYCMDCHRLQNVAAVGTDARSPHPPGYSMPGSGQFHGADARLDIVRCASCHDQGAQSVCIKCHRVGGVGGNPHPPEWLASHNRQEINTNGMCLYCHH